MSNAFHAVKPANRIATYANREEWLEARRQVLGGSDVAALFRCNPYKSEYELWAEKSGLLDSNRQEHEAMYWGLALEGPIADRYQEVTSRKLQRLGFTIFRAEECDYLGTTPDAEVVTSERNEPGLVSIKNVTAYKLGDWEDEPPEHYQIQLQAELAATGARWGSFAVLIGGNRFHWLDVERNDAFIELLFERVREFKARVDEKRPPEVDGSERTTEALRRLYAQANGTVELSASMLDVALEYEAIKEHIKSLTEQAAERKNRLLAAIGSASFGLLPDGSGYSRNLIEKKPFTVNPKPYFELRRKRR